MEKIDESYRFQLMDWRKMKRWYNKQGSRVEEAYSLGAWDAIFSAKRNNPYPPGIRHDEYDRGYSLKPRREGNA